MTVVTFLSTDIEGPTRRWEANPDAMRAALEAHNQVLRDAVDAHDGRVFNYTGDGMCAVFDSPGSAVDAAIAAQLALELPVRMGICTGEAELRGDDYSGTVLNRTARVMAACHGGQVLLDGSTAGLLSEVELISLGPRRLRDIAKPVQLFQVQSAGLPIEFPPFKDCRSDARQSPNTKHHLHRTRGRTCRFGAGAQNTPVGDPHRRRTGQHMTNAELSEYALDQIDRAREFLGHEETQDPPESL